MAASVERRCQSDYYFVTNKQNCDDDNDAFQTLPLSPSIDSSNDFDIKCNVGGDAYVSEQYQRTRTKPDDKMTQAPSKSVQREEEEEENNNNDNTSTNINININNNQDEGEDKEDEEEHKHCTRTDLTTETATNMRIMNLVSSHHYSHKYRKVHYAKNLFVLIIVNIVLHSIQSYLTATTATASTTTTTNYNSDNNYYHNNRGSIYKETANLLPRIVLVAEAAAVAECTQNSDCTNSDKICYENKCLCPKHLPVEDPNEDRCLAHSELQEPCLINEQCLADALCLDNICSCGDSAISIENPSANISYCHPKRNLNQHCNFEQQCQTSNTYCATSEKCLCLNGYAQQAVAKTDGSGGESLECLPKTCQDSSQCESEYHVCQDNRCMCIAFYFDIRSAKCHKYGSLGLGDDPNAYDNRRDPNSTNAKLVETTDDNNNSPLFIFEFLNVLFSFSSDDKRVWLTVLILLVLIILLCSCCVFLFVRRPFKRWTAQKSEFEPNNNVKNYTNNGSTKNFNKNSINNKSFRKKSSEFEGEDNDYTNNNNGTDNNNDSSKLRHDDRSRLVTRTTTTNQETTTLTSVIIDLKEDEDDDDNNDDHDDGDDCKFDLNAKGGVASSKYKKRSPLLAKSTAV